MFYQAENHHANQCPQKESKPEQAHMFFGVTDIISESNMKEKIEAMLEIDILKLINLILKNINTNQLFEPAINPQVSMTANKLLNDCLNQDNDILEIEQENYLKKKENSNEKSKKTLEEIDMEVEDNS